MVIYSRQTTTSICLADGQTCSEVVLRTMGFLTGNVLERNEEAVITPSQHYVLWQTVLLYDLN